MVMIVHTAVGLFALVFVLAAQAGEGQRVAVIGAGIGGASTAYYLHKWQPQASVTVFERNDYIGGRLKEVVLDGVTVEVGGDAWSQVNAYMVELAKELDIQFDNSSYSGNGLAQVWDGTRWYNTSSSWLGEAELFGLMEWLRGNLWLNYLERGSGGPERSVAFRSIGEFTRYGGLNQWTEVSCNELVRKYMIDPNTARLNWEPASRVIYDQDLRINSFAGMVVLLSALTTSYSVEGGNSQLVQKLLTKANAQVQLNTQVTRIARVGNAYAVSTSPSAAGGLRDEQLFDHVVLAAPIEFASLQWLNVSLPPMKPRAFKHWFVTHVVAKSLNPTYFNLPASAEMPAFVLTSNNSTAPFNSIATVNLGGDGNVIFKIFGNVNLTASLLESMFVLVKSYHVQYWPYTFPDLSPVPDTYYQPVVLGSAASERPTLVYLNSMESVATAMEASVIAGRNAALLLAQQ